MFISQFICKQDTLPESVAGTKGKCFLKRLSVLFLWRYFSGYFKLVFFCQLGRSFENVKSLDGKCTSAELIRNSFLKGQKG